MAKLNSNEHWTQLEFYYREEDDAYAMYRLLKLLHAFGIIDEVPHEPPVELHEIRHSAMSDPPSHFCVMCFIRRKNGPEGK